MFLILFYISASSGTVSRTATPKKRGRKRKLPPPENPDSSKSPTKTSSGSDYKFQAKQARLDKITGTLFDKVATTGSEDTSQATSPTSTDTKKCV